MDVAIDSSTRQRLLLRGLRLEYATVAWNVLEIGFVGYAAAAARSVALAGFAIDSGIEIFASAVVVRELRGVMDERRERRAVGRIGIAFFGLALYVVVQAAITLAVGAHPDASTLGMAWLAASAATMFVLAAAKSRVGAGLDHRVLSAEAKVTFVDGLLASSIFMGLILSALLGWWWADIAAGAVLVAYGIREGVSSLRYVPRQ